MFRCFIACLYCWLLKKLFYLAVQHTVMSVKLLSSEPEVEVPNGAAGYDFQVNTNGL